MRKLLLRLLCIFLCLVLVMANTPITGAYVHDARASEIPETSDSLQTKAEDVQDNSDEQEESQTSDSGLELPAHMSETLEPTIPEFTSGLLRSTFVSAAGERYYVSVEYDALAAIPQGAELRMSEPAATRSTKELRNSFMQALVLQKNDRIMQDAYLKLEIVADDQPVEPSAPVKLTVETSAFEPEQAASIEAALLAQDNIPGEHVLPQDLATTSSTTRLSMNVERLGTLALGVVVGEITSWQQPDLEILLLGPRFGQTVSLEETDAPQLEEGIEPKTCVRIDADASSAQNTTFWLEARPVHNAAPKDEHELGGTIAYSVEHNALQRTLFSAEGTTELVPFNVDSEQLLIVWDSGYRKLSLTMHEVSVEGLAPEGTSGSASDVSLEYGYPEGIIPVANEPMRNQAQKSSSGQSSVEYETIAAYDISLKTDGQEYQPDDEHPLTVTISDADISPNKALQLWHIQDDGTATQVENVEFRQGVAIFEATGFSTYLLTTANATSTQTMSTYFTLRATANTQGRSAKVSFVDQNKKPLNSTVSGTIKISYTGVADTSNETNTADLYSYADKLDPAIADEYEFSRVYLHLNGGRGDQKDFRYVQVGDGRNIASNGSTTVWRAYINMNGVHENKAGQDYNGTWYQLNAGGNIDPIFIEYYHVAKASFYAIDERNNPVQGAEFTLYSDSECYTPFEYKGEVVRATSNSSGLVSFGKIPRGSYYMKETVIPAGFKQTTKVYAITVDGQTTLPDVVHQDDDGSIVVSDVYEMSVTNTDHKNAAEVTVYCDDEVFTTFELNAACNWAHKISGLDPNKSYIISETAILDSKGNDITQDWAPEILTSIDPAKDKTLYYQTSAFQQGKEYALVINPGTSNSKALTGGSSLTSQYLETSAEEITGTVTDYMLWDVVKVSADGVITLQNAGNELYLDQSDAKEEWFQNSETPLFVRHSNDGGVIKIYYRRNLNDTTSYYLEMGDAVDRTDNPAEAANFAIFKKLNLHSAEVSITNKPTTYPMLIKNVVYPSGNALAGMSYKLYAADENDENKLGTLCYDNLVAASDGFLTSSGSNMFNLQAGSYFLVQQSKGTEGYEPLYAEPEQPLAFVVTRKGKIGIKGSYAIPSLEFSSTTTVGSSEYPLLRVPHYLPATAELQLQVCGDYANLDKEFEFTIGLPRDTDKLVASINGTSLTLTASNNSFTLKNGQALRIEGAHINEEFTITQEPSEYSTQVEAPDTSKATLTVTQSDAKAFTLSRLVGTKESPALIKITNSLGNVEVPTTGTDDNAGAWLLVTLTGLAALVGLPLLRRIRT